ncbi:fibronectin-binding protein [Leptospira perolatii]|uniref:Fibronectin-binding protein n=1 Tax=Leptospira perolatii TaxID=2023191 RepID=A0A2M9ZPS7_9LEPT|nr:fibronectin-binding protein [Leptospira perolatii]PJZ69051.1 fibronectin-binding protein [Leptospira perolatii]PJZ74080.1 fibronectin-binding protein [Leptospira perolatii]
MLHPARARVFAIVTVLLLAISFTYVHAQGLDIGGTYKVSGTNPNGSKYRGTVTISENPDGSYSFDWSVGSTFSGTGNLEGNVLTVEWGDTYPVIYIVKNGGKLLEGTWANGAATETLTR